MGRFLFCIGWFLFDVFSVTFGLFILLLFGALAALRRFFIGRVAIVFFAGASFSCVSFFGFARCLTFVLFGFGLRRVCFFLIFFARRALLWRRLLDGRRHHASTAGAGAKSQG